MDLETIKQIAAIAEEYKTRLAAMDPTEDEAEILQELDYKDLENATGVYYRWARYAKTIVYTIKDMGERVLWAVSDNGSPLQKDEIRLSDGRRGRIVHDMRLFSLSLPLDGKREYQPQWLLTMAGLQIPEESTEISPEEVARLTGLSVPGAEFIELSPDDFDSAWTAREFTITCYRYAAKHADKARSNPVNEIHYSRDALAVKVFDENEYNDENFKDEIRAFVLTASTDTDGIRNIAAISFEDLPDNVKLPQNLNATDQRVFNSVWSLWLEGNKYFSLKQVARLSVSGKRVTDAWLDQVKASIRKLQTTLIQIDNTAEIKAGHKYPVMTGRIEPMLRLISCIINLNGQVEQVYQLDGEPLLGKYSRERGRLFTFPSHSFALNPSVRSSVTLEDYIIRRVKTMGGKMRNTILLRRIYETLDIPGNDKKKRQQIKAKIINVLENLKDKGVISGYEMGSDKITIFPPVP